MTSLVLNFFVLLLVSDGLGLVLKDGRECSDTALACADGTNCIEAKKLCNYENDCADSSDERNMRLCKVLSGSARSCGKGEIKCSSYDSSYSYLKNACVDIVTACQLGKKCLNDVDVCEEIKFQTLKPPPETTESATKFEKLMEFIADSLNKTVQANFSSCPPFYSLYKSKCISVFTPIQISWSEAKLFCASTLGSLISLNDLESYGDLLEHLEENSISSDFWIGGFTNNTILPRWTWITGEDIKKGAPFWASHMKTWKSGSCSKRSSSYNADCVDMTTCEFTKALMPVEEESRQCLALLDENFYYFSNEDCSKKLSPICIGNAFDNESFY